MCPTSAAPFFVLLIAVRSRGGFIDEFLLTVPLSLEELATLPFPAFVAATHFYFFEGRFNPREDTLSCQCGAG